MPCARNRPPCGREGCGSCEERSLFARKAELASRNIECMLSDADMRKTSSKTRVFLVAWMCMACWHAWEALPHNVICGATGCPYCVHNPTDLCGDEDCTACVARSLFAHKDELATRKITCTLSDDQMLKTTQFSGGSCEWRCGVCMHTWDAPPDKVSRGNGCPYCYGCCPPCGSDECIVCAPRSLFAYKDDLKARSIESALDVLTMKRISGQQNLPKLPWRCIECDYVWTARANHVCGAAKSGCPVCKKPGDTETRVRGAVRAMDLGDVVTIVNDGEWMPPGGVDGNMRYRFDIHAKVYDDERTRFFVVEVDGEQHFGPWNRDCVGEDHAARLRRDVEKMAWAFERGVPIVRVPTSVVAWGSTEREHDWIVKLTELCRAAAEWTGGDEMPLFLYPGKEWIYTEHISELYKALSERRSKRARY